MSPTEKLPGRELSDTEFQRLLEFRDGLRRFLRWSEEQAQRAGVTPAQHQLLLAVRGHGSPPSVSDLAAHLLHRHHSTVELVDRATRVGLVRRVDDSSDHRVVRIALTNEGERRLNALATAHLEELSRIGPRFAALWSQLPDGDETPIPNPPGMSPADHGSPGSHG
ncbi:MAG: MarR family winged helix-turn-helix transcriptional regulator [Aquihabitans sp.]